VSIAPTIHADSALLVVSKPPGIAVIPARGEPAEDSLQKRLELERGERLFVVHRIDRETSGLVVFARTAEAHRAACLAFERREVSKRYLAFVAGRLEPREGRIELALHPARRGRMRPAQPGETGGLEAVTGYRVLERWSGPAAAVSLVEAMPLTGRQHQIRVHLRSRQTPILRDPVYGLSTFEGPFADLPCPRLALHAFRLAMPLATGGALDLEAPVPEDLLALKAWLNRSWSTEVP
jgi:RluA family pseudouridine synthase